MEKFFDLSLKIGKKIVVVLMFLMLLSIVLSSVTTIISFIPEKTKAPVFSKVLAEQLALYGDEEQNEKDKKEVKKYALIIDEIVKENDLNKYGKNVFVKHIESIDAEVRDEYTKGLKPFIKEYYEYMNGKKITEDMLFGVLGDYKQEYILNNTVKEVKQTTKDVSKVVSFSIFISSLLMFILCLLFPLLSRIEENTRK